MLLGILLLSFSIDVALSILIKKKKKHIFNGELTMLRKWRMIKEEKENTK
jgi:uncharacterized membrane protein affecting hemolysin expression